MKLSPQWLHEFVDLRVDGRQIDDLQLANDLTLSGIAVESIQDLNPQTIFEMEITTNRPDAMNHYGVARECSAIYDIPLQPIKPNLPQPRPTQTPFPIEIRDEKGCGRYTARVIRNVKIGSSPDWILDRLKIEDHNGVSNAVDASNYTLMEMGHPTHAFDLDKLEGGKIIVRRARPGEVLKTLDGVERKLVPEDLIIADTAKPVGLAGIMGGLESAISASTKNILIESAWFDPGTVRKSARFHGMHTDASHIFERGADWGAAPLACNRVAELILQTAGGELEGNLVDTIARHVVRHSIYLRSHEIRRILGQDIPESVIVRILRRLGFVPSPVDRELLKKIQLLNAAASSADEQTAWSVELPTWRLDIEREIDLIEEIARVYGYNKFANSLPSFSGGVIELPNAGKEARVRSELLALGYNEALSPTFIAPADSQAFSSEVAVPLANPLSEEQSMMRTSLLPGMLAMLGWNLNRGTTDVRLFEMGNVFSAYAEEATQERRIICLGATGNAEGVTVHRPARAFSFFDLKGDVETLLHAFEIRNLHFDAHASGYFHPGRSARAVARTSAEDQTVAQFGQLHPDFAAARKLKQEIYLAEINLDRLFQLPLRAARYEPLSRFPVVDRDFSFLFDDSVIFEQIQSAIRKLNIAELRTFQPVEIFRGGSIPHGKYSVLLRARFQSEDRTLRDDEVAQWSAQIMKALESLGGTIRA